MYIWLCTVLCVFMYMWWLFVGWMTVMCTIWTTWPFKNSNTVQWYCAAWKNEPFLMWHTFMTDGFTAQEFTWIYYDCRTCMCVSVCVSLELLLEKNDSYGRYNMWQDLSTLLWCQVASLTSCRQVSSYLGTLSFSNIFGISYQRYQSSVEIWKNEWLC